MESMFDHSVEKRLARLTDSGQGDLLRGAQMGVEKESLRVSPDGKLVQTPHPAGLGSPLTHPQITTDYSEALAEFITPPLQGVEAILDQLRDVQRFVYSELENDELLWATSMPCVVAGESSIPIAQYGDSNLGQMKTVYRRGLGHRYGRLMQVIAGVHFNYSLPEAFWPVFQQLEGDRRPLQDFISDRYFGLIRNLQRLGWLVPYLFGASPAVCKSFLSGQPTQLVEFDRYTAYQPYATSLRMGDIGYQNNQEAETGVKADYTSLDTYVDSLIRAITTPCPRYERIGVFVNGRWEQLNANLLQIENEYYSTIRPKQLTGPTEMPALALRRRGVRYVELRSLDVNAYDPLGICEGQLRFLEALLITCLLGDSPPIAADERSDIDNNELRAAQRGRQPDLQLRRHGKDVGLREWGEAVMDSMQGVCELLDAIQHTQAYGRALANQRKKLADPELTPSARMLAEMRANGEGFFHFAMRMSLQHREHFLSLPLCPRREAEFRRMTADSRQRQAEIEAADDKSFAVYLRDYFGQLSADA